MAYRYGKRTQKIFFPQSIEEYVPEDAPVRAYDAFVEALSLEELGFTINPDKTGRPQYDPRAMLKLLIYGYSYGVRSSRKLEREVNYNLSFIWLTGGLKPDHKTIAEFRRKNKKVIKKVLKLCARLCIKIDLIDGNVLFVDGTKVYANAATRKTRSKKYYKKKLLKIDERIEKLLEECETVDKKEQDLNSFVSIDKELAKASRLKKKIETVLEEFDKRPDDDKINETDLDAKIMKDKKRGFHAAYNVQAVTDEKHGLIVSAEAVTDGNDLNQLADQIETANEAIEKKCKTACGDAGYASTEEFEKLDSKQIRVIVPSQRQALHDEAKPFNKHEFRYDKERDCYYCPEGKRLRFSGIDKKTEKRHYLIEKAAICHKCRNFGVCTSAKRGRKVVRIKNEELKEKIEAQYEEPESQKIYKKRQYIAESVFGHMKENLRARRFLLRGRQGAQTETSLLSTCFNITKMIKILGGVGKFIRKVAENGAMAAAQV